MPTQLKCPSCSTLLQLPDNVPAGSAIRCPNCKATLRMPGKAPAPPASKPPTPPAPKAPAASPIKKSPPPKAASSRPPAPPSRAVKPVPAKAPPDEPYVEEVLEDDDEEVVRPTKSKSKKGLLIGCLAGVAVLFLVCGGVSFGVYRLISKGADQLKQSLNEFEQKLKEAEKKRLDVSFIHADCNAAFVIQPARIAQSKSSLLTPEDRDKIVASGIQEAGIDFTKVDQVIVVMEPIPPKRPGTRPKQPRPQPGKKPIQQPKPANDEKVPVTAAAILHFIEPVDGMQILNKGINQTEPVQAGNKTYYRSKVEKVDGAPLAGYFDGQRNVLMGPEPMIKKMLDAKDVHSPLTEKLREFELENDIFGIFLMRPFKPALKEMAQSPNLPPQLEQAKKLDQTLSAVKVLGNLDSDKLFQVILLGESDASGESLEDLARNALDMGKAFYPLFKTQMQQSMQREVPPQISAKIFKVTDQILKKDGITVMREGKDVTVTVNKPKDQ
jgi:LSD1 subclass zinc finger protein